MIQLINIKKKKKKKKEGYDGFDWESIRHIWKYNKITCQKKFTFDCIKVYRDWFKK